MTNKEAIRLIQGIEEDGWNVTSEHIEALSLAIGVLEQIEDDVSPCANCQEFDCYGCTVKEKGRW